MWLQQVQPWSLRQEATLYAGASFDTFTEMCHKACLSSHLFWFVTPYMALVQHTELCPNWLHSFVLVQFCFADRILCNFAPISNWLHFCTKLFFCTCDCTFLHVLHTEGSMHHSEQVNLFVQEKNVHTLMCKLLICTVHMFRALQFQCEQPCANDRVPLHCLTINVHNVYYMCIYVYYTCSLHCNFCVRHCPGELSVKGTRSLNRFSY